MHVLCVALLAAAALLVSGCGCFDEPGNAYTCTCERRCQGVTSTFNHSNTCTASAPVSAASSACVKSCSPEATCTSCTCTRGAACTIDHRCR